MYYNNRIREVLSTSPTINVAQDATTTACSLAERRKIRRLMASR